MKPQHYKYTKMIFLSCVSDRTGQAKRALQEMEKHGCAVIAPGLNGNWNEEAQINFLEHSDVVLFIGDWKATPESKKHYKVATAENKTVCFGIHELRQYFTYGDE